jgi:hypothetical protein
MLSRMLLCVESLRLREIARGVFHEVAHGLLTAEAIGLALNLRVDRAVRIYVFAQREAFCTHVVELAGQGQSRGGQTKQ